MLGGGKTEDGYVRRTNEEINNKFKEPEDSSDQVIGKNSRRKNS